MMRMVRWTLGIALVVLAFAARSAEIVDTAYVEQALARGAIVLDARDADDYADGHIPGAVNFGNVGNVLRDPNREDPVPIAVAEKVMGAAGVDPTAREVIVYTRKGDSYAYWGLNVLKYYGGKDVKVYHGGLDDWKAAGKPVAREATKLPPATVKLTATPGVVIWNDEMLDACARAARRWSTSVRRASTRATTFARYAADMCPARSAFHTSRTGRIRRPRQARAQGS